MTNDDACRNACEYPCCCLLFCSVISPTVSEILCNRSPMVAGSCTHIRRYSAFSSPSTFDLLYDIALISSGFTDGCIDYGEFVAMMQKGSNMGLGRRTMRKSLNMQNSLSISMRYALGAH